MVSFREAELVGQGMLVGIVEKRVVRHAADVVRLPVNVINLAAFWRGLAA